MASIQKIQNRNISIFQIKNSNSLNKFRQQLFEHHGSTLSFIREKRLDSYCCIFGQERATGQVALNGNVSFLIQIYLPTVFFGETRTMTHDISRIDENVMQILD